ncbi:MAG: hypothetical protein H7Y07_08490 [Pyrinomonadaceae bacterium]|nr:hypothetical protein [Sphingobacteriaceae bacterium]
MKTTAEKTPLSTKDTNTPTRGGLQMPAVPVFQKKSIVEEEPAQLKTIQRQQLVVQRVKVGGDGAGVMFLAASKFHRDLFHLAKAALEAMKAAGTDFTDVDAIVAAVLLDAAVATEAALIPARDVQIAELPDGTILRQRHITAGVLQRLNRPGKDDYELATTVEGKAYAFHIHPPHHEGSNVIPGEIMKQGGATGRQTSGNTITAIIATHGTPPTW